MDLANDVLGNYTCVQSGLRYNLILSIRARLQLVEIFGRNTGLTQNAAQGAHGNFLMGRHDDRSNAIAVFANELDVAALFVSKKRIPPLQACAAPPGIGET